MGVSIQDRTDFLNMLDACRTEQQLFSRLTFAVMFHQTDPDAREDLLDDVRGAACNMQLPAVNYKIDQWLNTCKQAWQADPAAFMAAVNADAKQRKLALEGSAAQPGLLADVPMQSVAWLVPQLLPLGLYQSQPQPQGASQQQKAPQHVPYHSSSTRYCRCPSSRRMVTSFSKTLSFSRWENSGLRPSSRRSAAWMVARNRTPQLAAADMAIRSSRTVISSTAMTCGLADRSRMGMPSALGQASSTSVWLPSAIWGMP